jgi:two-component system nitrogen regulation sensor histidine kinase NtrY
LGQAVGNIVKNAAEAIERLSETDEKQGLIEIKIEESDDSIAIIIEDNGPGFPEEARERLLEPYVTTREKGTGLGLAIVNRIIVDHGGAIQLQEREGSRSGARVRIMLPKHAELDELAEVETTEVLS